MSTFNCGWHVFTKTFTGLNLFCHSLLYGYVKWTFLFWGVPSTIKNALLLLIQYFIMFLSLSCATFARHCQFICWFLQAWTRICKKRGWNKGKWNFIPRISRLWKSFWLILNNHNFNWVTFFEFLHIRTLLFYCIHFVNV